MKGTPVELVTIEAEDGFPLDGVVYRPPAEVDRRAGVLLIHGKTGNCYSATSRFIPPIVTAKGFTCLSLNLRSHDLAYCLKSTYDRYGAAWEKPEEPPMDIRAGVRTLREEGLTQVALLGHSAGGLYVAQYAATDPTVDAVVLCSAIMSLVQSPVTRWFRGDAEGAERAMRQAEEMVAAGRGQDVIALPSSWWMTSAETMLSIARQDPEALLAAVRQITAPTFFLYGSEDPPPIRGGMERAAQASAARRKDVVVIEGGDHFYNDRQSIVANAVAAWLELVVER